MKLSLNYDSSQDIAQFLKALQIAPRKRWGQNFLINKGAREKIISLLNLNRKDHLIEIGSGLGSLTHQALQAPIQSLTVFEIDPAYQNILTNLFGNERKFKLIGGDVLKTWQTFFQNTGLGQSYKILGNLPYNISVAIIQKIAQVNFSLAVLTVQKELADRLTAKPKTKNYSSLSVWSQCTFIIEYQGQLKAGSFYPQPNIDSTIITLKPRHTNPAVIPILDYLVNKAFTHRRKTLKHNWNNLSQGVLQSFDQKTISDILTNHSVNYHMRAEEIESNQYLSIAQTCLKYFHTKE